jgi:hypothetical protein
MQQGTENEKILPPGTQYSLPDYMVSYGKNEEGSDQELL